MLGTYVVVLAGGRGTRFWPRSRRNLPKQCLALAGDRSLLRQTVDRVLPLVPPDRVLVLTGADMVDPVRAELPELPAGNFLVEPRGRNTAPCIGWAAVEVELRGGESMIVLPSDHRIDDEENFRAILRASVTAAGATGALVLLGMKPDRPHTGYGYLQAGDEVGRFEGAPFRHVERFVEKPDRATAERLVAQSGMAWNGGMFVWTVAAIRKAFAKHLPLTHAALEALGRGVPVEEIWDGTDAISIDYGVLERERNLLVVPCDFGWSDLGSWTAMEDVLPQSELGAVRALEAVALDAGGCIVDAPGKLVAALGVHDLVVVDTGDVLLLCARDQAQRIPELLATLDRRGLQRWL